MKKQIIAAAILCFTLAGTAQAAVETKNMGSWKIQYTYTDDASRALLDSELTDPSSWKPDGGATYSEGNHGLSLIYKGSASGTYVSALTTIDSSFVEPGKKYRLRLKRRSYMAFNSTIKIAGGVSEEVSSDVNISWGEGWTEYSYDFTADDSDNDISIEIRFTKGNADFNGSRLFIDEVSCCMLDDDGNEIGDNLIVNGNFEDEITNISKAMPVENVSAVGKIGSAELSWTNPSDSNFLKAKIYIKDGKEKTEVKTLKKGENSYTVTGLENGKEYTFLIVSIDTGYIESDGVEAACTTVASPDAPNVSADVENGQIIGIDETMEYKIDIGDWQSYNAQKPPVISGNHLVYVRVKATEDAPVGKSAILTFKKTEVPKTEKVTFTDIKQKNGVLYFGGVVANADRAEVLVSMKNADTGDYLFIKQLTTDKNGIFSAEIGLSDEISGVDMSGIYILKGNSDKGLLSDNMTVHFGNSEKRKAAIEKINSANSENEIAELFASDSEYLNGLFSLGFYADKYSEEYKKVIDGYFLDKKGSFDSNDENTFTENVEEANLLYEINAETDKAQLQRILAENDSVTNLGFVEFLSESEDELINWVLDKIAGGSFVTYDELNNEYKVYIALYKLNHATYMNLERILSENAAVLGIENDASYIKYKALSDKTATNKKLVTNIGRTPLETKNEVSSYIASSITTEQSGGSSSSGGGSGSSGSNGSSSGSGNSGVPVAGNPTVKAEENIFSDLKDAAWAEDAINALYKKNIISGFEDGTVHPNDYVTREQFVKMIAAAFGISGDKKAGFEDISSGAWYESSVNAAYSAGIVNGISESRFGIGLPLTREDMAVLINKTAEFKGLNLPKKTDKEFSDWDYISDYAKDSVRKLAEAGIINGMNNSEFSPKASATRAECATIIYNLIK